WNHEHLAPVWKTRDEKRESRCHVIEGLVRCAGHIAHIDVIGRRRHQCEPDMSTRGLGQKIAPTRNWTGIINKGLAVWRATKRRKPSDISWSARRLVAGDPQANAAVIPPHRFDNGFRQTLGRDATMVIDDERLPRKG